ncbi:MULTISPECIES: long-chain-fatty-acid--CoA ligase [Nocardiopsidaceae]|uniref:Long-chain fatty acid--CoA ligase n=1 Tax=Streptomonospora nanhaiensis TaxID=1323731 RepID=A0ABY6YRC5_9ACTN|nr:long-chain fatty acid--CoA ligase [Streptomonospora nanhaiensis]WAE74882.1 long-chain fatty acid--CoA ligase [Streptomonospora nanhaiensis]
MFNLSVLLEDGARSAPEKECLVFGDLRLNYALTDMIANQVADLLVSRGIRPGDRVALASPNVPYFPFVYFGALKAGAVVVPLNVLLTPREIAYHLEDSGAKALFAFTGTPELPLGPRAYEAFQQTDGCDIYVDLPAVPGATESTIDGAETFWKALEGRSGEFESVQTSAEDTAVIIYTSGTTGKPKGAELSHNNLMMNAIGSAKLVNAHPEGRDVSLVVLPLFHIFGQTVMLNACLYRHGTMVLMPRFDGDEALRLMEKEGVTGFAGVPTMYWGLLNAVQSAGAGEYDLEGIAANMVDAVSGGAALPGRLAEDFTKVFGVGIKEGYGLSETSPVASFNNPRVKAKTGSIGRPVWGVEMKLIDPDWNEVVQEEDREPVGEIAVRGHLVMKGYHNRPEVNAEVIRDGWFRTGDIARRDEEGFYFIIDRSKDMIIRGGYNVYPREVEEVLMTHDAVSLAAVVGVPHDTHGEEVKAFVIPKEGSDLTADELVSWSKERLAGYKYPREVEFRTELPMTSTGKILKRELRG